MGRISQNPFERDNVRSRRIRLTSNLDVKKALDYALSEMDKLNIEPVYYLGEVEGQHILCIEDMPTHEFFLMMGNLMMEYEGKVKVYMNSLTAVKHKEMMGSAIPKKIRG